MKIVTFRTGSKDSYGIIAGDGIIDCGKRLDDHPTLRSLLAGAGIEALKPFVNESPDDQIAAVTLLPPIVDPRKILCIGVNYATHLVESGHPPPRIRAASAPG